jgi:hypothetical protein
MPFIPLSVAVLVCEKVLRESDEVVSAIRVVDLFYVPEGLPEGGGISAQVLLVVKTLPSNETHRVSVQHEIPDGSIREIATQEEISFQAHVTGPTVPVGMVIQLDMKVAGRLLGTHNVRLLVDGDEIGRAYFTLLRRTASAV